jgi:hypothetical protein
MDRHLALRKSMIKFDVHIAENRIYIYIKPTLYRVSRNWVPIAQDRVFVSNSSRKFPINIRECIQKYPDWVDNEVYAYNNKHSLRSNTKGYGGKTH